MSFCREIFAFVFYFCCFNFFNDRSRRNEAWQNLIKLISGCVTSIFDYVFVKNVSQKTVKSKI